MNKPSHSQLMAIARDRFLKRLASGPSTFVAAMSGLELPEGFNGRLFGPMVAGLHSDGVIEPLGFAPSKNTNCHSRLWRLVDRSLGDPSESLPRFEVPSGRLVVADPCYLTNKDLAVVIANAKPGRWMATVAHHENFVSSVTVFHESDLVRDGAVDRETMHRVGVDTARVCIVDSRSIDCYEDSEWSEGVKVDRFGLIVPSGFGDWIYEACVREFKGQAVSIRIVFIGTEGTK